ncbi:MAG: hypothetical protein WKG00_17360 [Polyangiaceae bacterium]
MGIPRPPAAAVSVAVRAALAVMAIASAGCSLGQGTGEVKSDSLYAAECWLGRPFDLQPDFFAAVPFRDTLAVRVQRGTDLQEVSDGLAVLIDDTRAMRVGGNLNGKELCVSLPPGVEIPGAPPVGTVAPDPLANGVCNDQYLVHAALYLGASCHNQNTTLYAVSGTIVFDSMFSGDPNEDDAVDKLIEARSFTFQMGDPRDAPDGAPPTEIPADKLTTVTGSFSFYFERGQPGQPFP